MARNTNYLWSIYGEITCYSYGSIRSINLGKLYRPHCSPKPGYIFFFKRKSSPNGPRFQVSEILSFTQNIGTKIAFRHFRRGEGYAIEGAMC